MKLFAWLLPMLLMITACGNRSDTSVPATETAKLDDKPFVLETALAKANAEKKFVLLEFTGSDWCPPCKMLEKEVLSTTAFKNYSEANLVFGKLDFPRAIPQTDAVKKNNSALAETFNIASFPTLILLNAEGKEIWRQVGFAQDNTPKGLIAELESRKN